jgi:hypothetical protein
MIGKAVYEGIVVDVPFAAFFVSQVKIYFVYFIFFYIILFISTWHHHITSFLSLLSERREMRASEKCHPGFGFRIEPRSSCTGVVCATVCATPHPLV